MRFTWAILLACFTLTMAAQEGDEGITVKFTGTNPSITDFVRSYLDCFNSDDDVDECDEEGLVIYKEMSEAMSRQGKGLALNEGSTLTIDQKNGYILYEQRNDNVDHKVEMCFWNMADGKHKLFASNRVTFLDGKYVCGQYDGIEVYRYSNARKTMIPLTIDEAGLDAAYGAEDGAMTAFSLPRTGKDITVSYWWLDNSNPKQRTLKFNGQGFVLP